MSLNTSLKGRLRNTHLPLTNGLFPLFEAVVNSIHSLDSALKQGQLSSMSEGRIIINILRSSQVSAFHDIKAEIIGFEIIDNGVGFNNDNFNSFNTLDSLFKSDLGCRGVGRLLWLKAFNRVNVKSVYKEDGLNFIRKFDFNETKDIHNDSIEQTSVDKIETSISLLDIRKEYLKYLRKTSSSISRDLLEHCLWYFIRNGGAPDIYINDSGNRISLNKEYEEMMLNAADTDSFNIKTNRFYITHVKLKSSLYNKHNIIYSAANRVVKEESLQGRIPGLFGLLNDGVENFTYVCFLTSDYLTDNVTPERIGFNISETNIIEFDNDEVSFCEIRENTLRIITEYLEKYLIQNKQIGIQRVFDFIDTKAPRYKPILSRLSESDRIVDPNITDKELEIKLHSHLMLFESNLIAEGHELLIPNGVEDKDNYSKRIAEYLTKAGELKRSDLANYVSHRRIILDLLRNAINKGINGKYSREEILHKLIMPMQVESNDIRVEDTNLWLIDERLAFHNYLASDKTLLSSPITNSDSTKEPDLLALNIYDNPLLVNDRDTLPLASITVIEIKRPMRNDAKAGEEKDPIEQALGYLKRVRNGKVVTRSGRPIPNSEQIPGFCYVISDLTPTIKERCEILNLIPTADKLGFFGYNSNFNAYIEVISYDRLLNMATERNKAFFDKLGLPTN